MTMVQLRFRNGSLRVRFVSKRPDPTFDTDGDGYGDNASGTNGDRFPNNANQWSDTDGDGYGDNSGHYLGDGCPDTPGTSSWPVYGCPDFDDDGVPNECVLRRIAYVFQLDFDVG